MNITPRIVPERYWRILLFCIFVFAFIVIIACMGFFLYFLATFDNNQELTGLPEWVGKVVLPLFRRYFFPTLIVFGLIGFLLAFLILILAINFLRADEFKIWLVEFKVSDKLKETQELLEAEIEISTGLKENLSEIEKLIDSQASLLLSGDVVGYFEHVDQIINTSVLIFRSYGKESVRISLWLGNNAKNTLKIIGSYRIPHKMRSDFSLPINGNGFVPFVLRNNSPQVKSPPDDGGAEWAHCPFENYKTTSIFGQEVKVGDSSDWRAVICFSTDRDLERFPDNEFSLAKDAAVVAFVASFISFTLTLSDSTDVEIQGEDTRKLIDMLYERYNNT